MKTARRICAAIVILAVLFLISIPVVNNLTAQHIEHQLTALPLPPDTERIDSVSKAGKLAGSGNGMQYFGAILIKSALSQDELDAYYSQYREGQWDCLVTPQPGQTIELIEIDTIAFDQPLPTDGACFLVYTWGDGIDLYEDLDIRGH